MDEFSVLKSEETLYVNLQNQDRRKVMDEYANKNKKELIIEIERLKSEQNNSEFHNFSNPTSRHNMNYINKLQYSDGDIYGDNANFDDNETSDFLNSNVFINCVNAIIKKDDDDDDKFIDFFKTKKISEYKSEHFSYIKKKVDSFLKLEPSSYEKCFKKIKNYKKIVCSGGIILASMYFLSNIFTFFSTGIQVSKIKSGTEDYKNLKRLYDIFLNNLNAIVRKTIDISKYFENKLCDGKTSSITTLADVTYDNLFQKTKNTKIEYKLFDKVDLQITFLEKLRKSFFGQIIIFIAIAYIFYKLINMLN